MRARLNFANVAAGVALFLAMGGGAYAAASGTFVSSGGVISACVKRGGALLVVKPGRHCPRGTAYLPFNQRGARGATGARGPRGATGATGATGKAGANGKNGADGAPGTALGYARVFWNGTETGVVNSRNVTSANVTRVSEGVYCFHGLPFTISNIQATLGFTGGDTIAAQAPGTETECKEPGNQAEVLVREAHTPIDAGFMVLFD